MSNPLQGKRILITRPAHQCAGWQATLASEGAASDCIPLLDIAPLNAESDPAAVQAIKNLILDFDQFDHAIFVSQNAVRYGFDWLDDYWPQLPQGPRYYAVGAATARAIIARGAEPCVERERNSMDSEALLALTPLQNPQGERIVIFRGCGGRTLMGDTLRERGARVEYCELYQRLLPTQAAAQIGAYRADVDAITVHSGETLDNLHRAIESSARAPLRQALILCPSERVADSARALGFPRVHAAVNAGDTAMLTALKDALAADHS